VSTSVSEEGCEQGSEAGREEAAGSGGEEAVEERWSSVAARATVAANLPQIRREATSMTERSVPPSMRASSPPPPLGGLGPLGWLESLPLPAILWDIETLELRGASRAARDLLGYGTDELRAMQATQLRRSEDLERFAAFASAPDRPRQSGQWQLRGRQGRLVEVDAYGQDLLDGGRRLRLEIFCEAGERRRAESALRDGQERLRALFDQAPDAIVIVRADDGVWDWVNQGFLRLTGFGMEEVAGRRGPAQQLWPDATTRDALAQAQRGGPAVRDLDTTLRTKGGGLVPCLLSARRIPLGERTCLLLWVHDLSARKKVEEDRDRQREQLRHAQKMEAVGRLAGGVAHDFNNMMTVISNFTEFLLTDLEDGSAMRDDLEQIRAAARRATALTAQLLAFSRRQLMKPQNVDPNLLVRDAAAKLRRMLGDQVRIHTELHAGPANLRLDPAQFEQVLVNLALNARDAMPRGGDLVLETARVQLDLLFAERHPDVVPGDYIRLAVNDTGTGMDADTRAKAFEPFFTTKGAHGKGLGLATVYGVVRQSGGHVWIYSEPGRGTSVKIYLPVVTGSQAVLEAIGAPPPPKPAPDTEDGEPRGSGETILVVDDEDLVREAVRAALTRLGYRPLVANGGDEADALFRKEQGSIALLLSDVVMPGEDGPAVARRLRALQPDLKVLFMSGFTESAVVRGGLLEERLSFLEKPFTQESLGQKVFDVLRHSPR
jgi:PAS domain S-box-containing protein